jgi:ATP-binding cassette, subfamily B, bacterial MsbA
MILSSYRRLLPYAKPFRFKFAVGLLLNVIASYFNLIVTLALLPAMGIVLGETSGLANISKGNSSSSLFNIADLIKSFKGYFTFGTPEEALLRICLFMLISYTLKNLFSYFGNYLMSLAEGGMSKALRDTVFEKLANLSLDYFYDRRTGQLLARVTDDVGVTNGAIISSIMTLVR